MTQERGRRRARPDRIEIRMGGSPVSFHADGVWGGLTPKAQIVMGFFTEQFAVPDRVTYQLPDNLPGQLTEVDRVGGGHVVREIQAQIFITPDLARTLIPWIQERLDQIDAMENSKSQVKEDSESPSGSITLEEEPK